MSATEFEVVINGRLYKVAGADLSQQESAVIRLPDGRLWRCYGPLYQFRGRTRGRPRYVQMVHEEPDETVVRAEKL